MPECWRMSGKPLISLRSLQRRYSHPQPGILLLRPQLRHPNALIFMYDDGEKALTAAKKTIKGHPTYRFHRTILPDGTDCFEVLNDGKVIERHIVLSVH